ncbi:DEAD/DEAH box helicase family protein [Desulfallas sp. Bu1-1]|uniref:helicase C-terminal domain-containing protein n=1 Tax=Desulfallas sp. Bu1-1 TaxID=2787620 RepID=UPI00189C59C9|nr:helicase C-terminal domain-containing protein [Desulfallas sp. Bu1-1]MBF7083318.1 DEAD/DEAH box helicase family protein [Desulfallas sp. Bu1-1]
MRDFIVCDLETTGFIPGKDKIMEIALIKVVNGIIVDKFYSLINPECKIPLRIKRLTGINEAELFSSPTLQQVFPHLSGFMLKVPLVGHNIGFDRSFLEASLDCRLPFTDFLDTLELARIITPELPGHSLGSLSNSLRLNHRPQHRALDDALATAELLFTLLSEVSLLRLEVLFHLSSLLKAGKSPWAKILEDLIKKKMQHFAADKISGKVPIREPAKDHHRQAGTASPKSNHNDLTVDFLLGPDSPLSRVWPNYQFRREQVAMARAVNQSLHKQKILLAEAGTGTGKSLAYLLPALLWSCKNHQRTLIATNTINLQEQIWQKDIPLLQKALDFPFRAALLKGRQNYICLRRFFHLLSQAGNLAPEEAMLMARTLVWLQKTDTGDRAELALFGQDNETWLQMCSDSESCLGSGCGWFNRYCFVSRARWKAENSELVIINHSLLFSNIASDYKLLPPHGALVIDEAHHIVETATRHLGIKVSGKHIMQWLSIAGKTIRRLSELRPPQRDPGWPAALKQGEQSRHKLTEHVKTFFRCLIDSCIKHQKKTPGYNTSKIRLHREKEIIKSIEADYQNMLYYLRDFNACLKNIAKWVDTWSAVDMSWDKTTHDLGAIIETGSAFLADLTFIMENPPENYVCWIEIFEYDTVPGENCVLNATPIDVSELLCKRLFDTTRAIILTSATMTVDNNFEYYIKQCGLDRLPAGVTETLIVESPFNYEDQCLLCIPDDIPLFGETSGEHYINALVDTIFKLVLDAGGRTLVLFTSHKLLRDVYYKVKPLFDEVDICLLGHNLDGGRSKLVEEFSRGERCVLFGSSSFWEGVDIPGDTLVQVIIVKLPFAPPNDPVFEARNEKIITSGLNGFYELSLPNAVIRFKQGFGRLIRGEKDRGAVIVLDRRITKKQYGRIFLNSLPVKSYLHGDVELIKKKLTSWI